MKKWSIPGAITGGQCTLVVEAETKEEALIKFQNSEWDAEDGSWECEPDMSDFNDVEELKSIIEEC